MANINGIRVNQIPNIKSMIINGLVFLVIYNWIEFHKISISIFVSSQTLIASRFLLKIEMVMKMEINLKVNLTV
ncbi:hypothetical protein BLOT_000271 [Blomia tropicalis]|nr:hypothetical protein BLOT_000271 [Blomia tropicalis]